MQADFQYRGAQLATLSLPLGGIGTGCVGLAGNGHLIDWEIFNRPNKQSLNGFTHLAVKAEGKSGLLDARVLQGPPPAPYTGAGDGVFSGFGFGPSRYTLGGAPCFSSNEMEVGFPLACIRFQDTGFPGRAALSAFNPFIPREDRDSSFPAAFFQVELTNTTDEPLRYTVAFTLANPHDGGHDHQCGREEGLSYCLLGRQRRDETDPQDGEVAVATDAQESGWQPYWYRGKWFDGLNMFWHDFARPGPLPQRSYPPGGKGEDAAVLTASALAAPGETVRLRFVLSWYYPNQCRYWGDPPASRTQWHNYYATQWPGALAVAREALRRYDELYEKTRVFHDALFGCTLPRETLDAVSANLSILKSPTVLRLEDGSFYGWEGCMAKQGSCEGSCTHVWNYAYALPFLFPALERSMRELDYTYNLKKDGGMPFRLQLPLGAPPSDFRPCVDGQMGGIMKMYREWKISGDTAWLRRWWPSVKKSLAYAWSPENPDRWDPEQSGLITGRQHHTLDMELFGPNSWLTGFYLGALKAAGEMARALDDPDAAQYEAIFERGRARADAELFNGSYYVQRVDLSDRKLLEAFAQGPVDMTGERASETYWNQETGEMKYQIGEGCAIDQVVAQWHANLMGLGRIFDLEQTAKAMDSVYRYNFKPRLGEVFNPCRLYGLADEAGTMICAYPPGAYKPAIAVPYAEETMHGFEYQAAIHLLQLGRLEEGFAMIAAVRRRYDGERRNPFNEMECGSNYARSMASFAALAALSGFSYDMTRGMIGFSPQLAGDFSTLWSLEPAWGTYCVRSGRAKLSVLGGCLPLRRLALPGRRPVELRLQGEPVSWRMEGEMILLEADIMAGQQLEIL